ncbi:MULTISPECIES: hypothetical protein [Prochlorococcus]|uniref:Uncharacterized protein n=1 Tax=Prochlorococcus marinus str. MIT 9116 TaxID=167544 RepID=A0A0A1ZRM3_PROMR|nr:hypothetical protein [Prochlorococcus marinus]KGF90575.1 hypothetical protein EU92_0947 [Prochlorococcus marinus str. MIT 9107]KGF90838.1 hypothetical protein EU93_1437 [Prochlorococcus marinus str. MIT 9116]
MLDLAKKIILKVFNPKIIKAFGLYYLFLVTAFKLLQGLSIPYHLVWIISAILFRITSTIYKTIFIENIRLENYYEIPVIKNKKKLFIKSWIVFRNALIGDLFIVLGIVLLIFPGIILAKRFQYVDVISEDLSLGPLKSLKLSSQISKKRGWEIFFSNILISISITFPIYFLILLNKSFFDLANAIYLMWVIYSVDVFIIMPNYKKHINEKLSN